MRRTNAFQGLIFGPDLCAALLLSLALLACVPASPVATRPTAQPSPTAPSAPATTQSTPIPTATSRQQSTASPSPSLSRPQPELPATALGEDCSRVERLAPESPEARTLVAAFEEAQQALVPFDPLHFESVHDVTLSGDYLVIRGQRYEFPWTWAGRIDGQGVEPLAAFVPMNGVVYSRYTLHDFFGDILPEAPPELFGCLDITYGLGPLITSDDPPRLIDAAADCAALEAVDPGAPEVEGFIARIATELGARSSWLTDDSRALRVGDWLMIVAVFEDPATQTRFDGAYLVREPNDFLFGAAGALYSRRLFVRAAYRHFPDVPLALLSCAKPAINTNLAFLVSHGYYAFESFYSSSAITGSTPQPLTPAGRDWYRDERIALPATQLVGRSEDEIAVALMARYLEHFASPDADSASRLLEFRDVAVLDVDAQTLDALARENDATFARRLTYSVRPYALELNVWIAGNGDIDNASGWVTSKTLFVAITLSGDDYVFEPLGTG